MTYFLYILVRIFMSKGSGNIQKIPHKIILYPFTPKDYIFMSQFRLLLTYYIYIKKYSFCIFENSIEITYLFIINFSDKTQTVFYFLHKVSINR